MKKLYCLFLVFFIALAATAFSDCLCRNQVLGNRLSMVTEPQNQTNSSLVVDPSSGNYFLAWQENGRIKGRLFGSHGGKAGPASFFQQNTTTPGNWADSDPLVVFNTVEAEFFVIWHSTLVDPNFNTVAFEVRAGRVSAAGVVNSSVVVTTAQVGVRKIVFNPNSNEYAILYSPVQSSGIQPVLFAQRIDKNGMLVGTSRKINSPGASEVIQADFVLNSRANRYLVTWDTSSTMPSRVKYVILGGTLDNMGGIKIASSVPAVQPRPVALYDSKNDRFLLFWRQSSGLNVRAIHSGGTTVGTPVSLGNRGALAAAFDPNSGSVLLAYIGRNRGLFLTRIDETLRPIGNDFLASCQLDHRIGVNPIRAIFNPVLRVFLIVWPYVDASPKSWDIYGQQVRATSIGQCS